MHPLIRNGNIYHYWRPDAAHLHDIPYEGFRLDERPQVFLANLGAGSVTTGTHRYKIAALDAGGTTKCGDPSATVTTDTASNGKVAVILPELPDSATGFAIYRTEAAGSTFKLVATAITGSATGPTVYIDDVADGALGATEPGSNTTTTPLVDPTLVSARISALTAGPDCDYLVAYFVCGYRWIELAGAANNALLFVPGTFTGGLGIGVYPHDPEGYEWAETDTPSGALTIPSFSSDWSALEALLDAADALDMPVTIEYGSDADPNGYTVTCSPAGGTAAALSATSKASLALNVCKVLLTVVHDVDWF